MNDLGDHLESVLAAEAETDEREIGMLTLGRGSDIRDLDFPRDDLMAQAGNDVGYPRESVRAFICDQDTQASQGRTLSNSPSTPHTSR
jgi:hypothetical protein